MRLDLGLLEGVAPRLLGLRECFLLLELKLLHHVLEVRRAGDGQVRDLGLVLQVLVLVHRSHLLQVL